MKEWGNFTIQHRDYIRRGAILTFHTKVLSLAYDLITINDHGSIILSTVPIFLTARPGEAATKLNC